MARSNFRVEQGLEILDANGTGAAWVITGSGAPAGTSGPTDSATIGSLYLRKDGEGELYRKVASTSSASDWEAMSDKSVFTALGISFDAENMGTYTGPIITDGTSQASINQELSDAIEAAGTVPTTDVIPAATPTTVSTVLVDSFHQVEWEVVAFLTATPATKHFFKVTAVHDGTASADATTFDESSHTKLKTGTIAGLTFTSVLAGTGAGQTLGLEISATAGITVMTRKTMI